MNGLSTSLGRLSAMNTNTFTAVQVCAQLSGLECRSVVMVMMVNCS